MCEIEINFNSIASGTEGSIAEKKLLWYNTDRKANYTADPARLYALLIYIFEQLGLIRCSPFDLGSHRMNKQHFKKNFKKISSLSPLGYHVYLFLASRPFLVISARVC